MDPVPIVFEQRYGGLEVFVDLFADKAFIRTGHLFGVVAPYRGFQLKRAVPPDTDHPEIGEGPHAICLAKVAVPVLPGDPAVLDHLRYMEKDKVRLLDHAVERCP